MGTWENLPFELLVTLFSYLPQRDRLSCWMVCENWRDSFNSVVLWKTVKVNVDTDFADPSTILFSRVYGKYLRNLEFGLSSTPKPNWIMPKKVDKRVVRFLLILYEYCEQINSIKILNWTDFENNSKITYHLCRYMKIQANLKNVTFHNTNMHSDSYLRILAACLGSRNSIIHLDLCTCYYRVMSFDPVYIQSCVEQLRELKTLKIDYFVLSCDLIEALLTLQTQCGTLENLHITVKEIAWYNNAISESDWHKLCRSCPKLRVSFDIRNVCHHEGLRIFLKNGIPLVSFTLTLPRIFEKNKNCNFSKTLSLLFHTYYRTLENIEIHVRHNNEFVDDCLIRVVKRCPCLKNCSKDISENKSTPLDSDFQCSFLIERPNGSCSFRRYCENKDDINKRVEMSLKKKDNCTACILTFSN